MTVNVIEIVNGIATTRGIAIGTACVARTTTLIAIRTVTIIEIGIGIGIGTRIGTRIGTGFVTAIVIVVVIATVIVVVIGHGIGTTSRTKTL